MAFGRDAAKNRFYGRLWDGVGGDTFEFSGPTCVTVPSSRQRNGGKWTDLIQDDMTVEVARLKTQLQIVKQAEAVARDARDRTGQTLKQLKVDHGRHNDVFRRLGQQVDRCESDIARLRSAAETEDPVEKDESQWEVRLCRPPSGHRTPRRLGNYWAVLITLARVISDVSATLLHCRVLPLGQPASV